jgi:calpain-7
MRRQLEHLPVESEQNLRALLTQKISHYEAIASNLMNDDSSSAASSWSPRSPFEKEFFTMSKPIPSPLTPVAPAPAPVSSKESFVNALTSRANQKLTLALDLDEAAKPSEAMKRYLEASELFLQAIKEGEGLEATAILKRRLQQTLDRVEAIKRGKKLVVQDRIGYHHQEKESIESHRHALTAEEIQVLKKSSTLVSGLFLPWSDDEASDLSRQVLAQTSFSTLYTDPSGFLSLNSRQQKRFYKWARPSEIIRMRQQAKLCQNQKVCLIQAITPYTIRQQFVTDCSFIASLCICAAFERRFGKRLVTSLLFPQTNDSTPFYNPFGKYMLKLWLNGVARSVTVDDYLPVDKYGNLLCSETTKSSSPYLELWVPLIEKAFLKLAGGYGFPGSNSGVDLFSLTGWIPERILFAENASKVRDFETPPERVWERILSASSFGDCLVTVGTERGSSSEEEEIQSTGLVTGHAYAVLSVIETRNGTRLLQLKNPWAHQGWKGRYCSRDLTSWSDPAFRAEVGYDPEKAMQQDDGVFWISWQDILRYFQNFHLSWNPALFRNVHVTHGAWPKVTSSMRVISAAFIVLTR